MANYSIGISGLNAAQKAIDIIGNNMANAATPGYHRQRINLSPAYASQTSALVLGGGVNAESVTRLIDNLLEKEILREQSLLEQVSKEYTTLRTIENAFGELSTEGGLNSAIDDFFNSLSDLSNHPGEVIWQNQVLSNAQFMASRFRTLGDYLSKLDNQIQMEAENIIVQANLLIDQIADLNKNIERIEISGASANNLRDQRDQCIAEPCRELVYGEVARAHNQIEVQ